MPKRRILAVLADVRVMYCATNSTVINAAELPLTYYRRATTSIATAYSVHVSMAKSFASA